MNSQQVSGYYEMYVWSQLAALIYFSLIKRNYPNTELD